MPEQDFDDVKMSIGQTDDALMHAQKMINKWTAEELHVRQMMKRWRRQLVRLGVPASIARSHPLGFHSHAGRMLKKWAIRHRQVRKRLRFWNRRIRQLTSTPQKMARIESHHNASGEVQGIELSRHAKDLVSAMLDTVPSRTQFILFRRLGLWSGRPSTLAEIGNELHLSRERVRQIENEGKAVLTRSYYPYIEAYLLSASRTSLGATSQSHCHDDQSNGNARGQIEEALAITFLSTLLESGRHTRKKYVRPSPAANFAIPF